MSDSKYERDLVEKLISDGFFARRVAGSGTPDVIAVRDGVPFLIEVKSSKKKKRYLSSSGRHDERSQFFSLILSKKKYKTQTHIFYRYKSRGRGNKWRVYDVPKKKEEIKLDQTEKSIILTWDDCYPYKEWVNNV